MGLLEPNLFSPEYEPGVGYSPETRVAIQRAKAVCSLCPVTRDCERYAERVGAVGIWAGQLRGIRRVKASA